MRIAIEKIIGLLKNQSSKESNVKIHRLAYITNSKFDGNNYIDGVKSGILTLVNTVILDLVVILIM